MAEPASSPNDPPPAPGIPEIRIRKGSDISGDENHVDSGAAAEVTSLTSVEEDAVSKDDVFVGEDPYTQGYGQLADGDSPFGIKLEHPGAHEPSGVEDDDNVTTVSNPDAPSPVSMDVDQDEDEDGGEQQGGGGYQQMMDVDNAQNGNEDDDDDDDLPLPPPPEPEASIDAPEAGAASGATDIMGGWDTLEAASTPGSTGAPATSTTPMLDLDFEMFDTLSKPTTEPEPDAASDSSPSAEGTKKPPPRPPGSPSAPRRPLSPAAGAGRRSVSPARPEPPRSRSPARPRSPISRSKSPARPPPPKSPQTVGAEGAKKAPPARPPSRPPPRAIKKAPAPNPADFDQEESELVEINAKTQEDTGSLSKSGTEGDLLSPESTGGDASDGGGGGLDTTMSSARDRPRSITPANKTSLQDYAASSAATEDKTDDERIKITLPKHQLKARSKSPKKSPSTEPMDTTTSAATPRWTTFEDSSPMSPPEQSTPSDQASSSSPGSEGDEVPVAEKKKPPPRPAPPANAPSRPPPPSAAARQKAGQKNDAQAEPASRTQAARVAKEHHKEKKPKSISKKIMGIGKGKKKHKADDRDYEEFLKGGGDDVPPAEKSAEFAAFEAMQARIAGAMTATQGRLDNLGKEVDKTIAHIEATNSPWTVMIGGAPGEPTKEKSLTSPLEDDNVGGSDFKAGWEGFGDDSFSNMSGESVKKLAALSVTPIPSPKHPPVPPNNSRRNSGDEAPAGEEDLLGLTSGGDAGVTEKKEEVSTDLLGLMGGEDGAPGESGGMLADTRALSRNPLESARSSGMSTPNPAETDPYKQDGGTEDGKTAVHDPYIDEFLGLESDKNKEAAVGASGTDDDDPFGLGTTQKDSAGGADPTSNMDLMTGATHDEDDDPFALPPEVNAIAAGENITEAPEPEKETTGADFLNMAVQVVKESENEKKERDPEDFGGFGTPQVASEERKVETITTESKKSGKSVVIKAVARPRPKKQVELASFLPPPPMKEEIKEANDLLMISPGSDEFDPRADFDAEVRPMPDNADSIWASGPTQKGENPFKADVDAKLEAHKAANNPFLATDTDSSTNPFAEEKTGEEEKKEGEEKKEEAPHDEFDIFGPVAQTATTTEFNPFATIVPDDDTQAADAFDPFATIQGDDAFVDIKKGAAAEAGKEGEGEEDKEGVTSPRVNPFDKEPPLDEKFASFEPKTKSDEDKPNEPMFEAFTEKAEDEVEQLEPLPPYREPFTGDGWHLLLRQPSKKKLTSNRYWKTVYVRLVIHRDTPTLRVFNNDKDAEVFHELPLQPCYQMCDMGLQQYDQYGKCHTVKVQYVFYRERVGVKADRITPTLGDIARVRDLKGLKDLVHKPKATMLLDHAPQASELLKFGSLDYDVFRSFVWTLEDAFFHLIANREVKSQNYTKDEITIDIVDEYYLEIDTMCHITYHKARVRAFCLAFLTGNPTVELGINDKRRKGKEIVGRKDIIPIRTDEWIHIEDPTFHNTVDQAEYEKTKVIKFIPLDACHSELMRFRTRPRKNRELPLQIRVQQSVVGNHMEIRADVIIPGYFSNSRRAQQTPCEDITIVFPIPETWVYMFRVEKRFKYGSVKATTRKPGKIKGLERLTMMAQGLLPPALIEVSSGGAKYENVFHGIVWRIARLPERNEGAYKQHFFKLRVDLGPHDVMPDTFEKYVAVQFQMPNSMVSRAQVRSIGVSDVEDPPDRWVHHLAKYEYLVEVERVDQTRTEAPEALSSIEDPTTPDSDEEDDDEADGAPSAPKAAGGEVAEDTDSSSSDDD